MHINSNQNKFPMPRSMNMWHRKRQKKAIADSNLIDQFKIEKPALVDTPGEIRRNSTERTRRSSAKKSKRKVSKKATKTEPETQVRKVPKQIEIYQPNFYEWLKTLVLLVLRVVSSTLRYFFVYGTELIVQLMAICTVSAVILLKYLESFFKSRALTIVINRMESVNISRFRARDLTFSIHQIYTVTYRILWVCWKLIEFMAIILKHFVLKLSILIMTIISFCIVQSTQFVTQMVFAPSVNKIMNFLSLDPNAISAFANFQVRKVVISVMFNTTQILPQVISSVLLLSNLRYYILQIKEVKVSLLSIIDSVKMGLYSVSALCHMVFSMVVQTCKIFASIGDNIKLVFNSVSALMNSFSAMFSTFQLIGYYVIIFCNSLSALTSSFARCKML